MQAEINNKKLCNLIYDAYINKNEPTIDIDYINKIIKFKNENAKKKYLKYFISFMENCYDFYVSELTANEDIDNLYDDSDNDSNDEDSDDSNNENYHDSNIISKSEYLKEYFVENKLTLKGFQYYINELKFEYLINIKQRCFLINFNYNILNGFIDGMREQFNELKNISSEKKIYGI